MKKHPADDGLLDADFDNAIDDEDENPFFTLGNV
jgi:hypothetical protein